MLSPRRSTKPSVNASRVEAGGVDTAVDVYVAPVLTPIGTPTELVMNLPMPSLMRSGGRCPFEEPD